MYFLNIYYINILFTFIFATIICQTKQAKKTVFKRILKYCILYIYGYSVFGRQRMKEVIYFL